MVKEETEKETKNLTPNYTRIFISAMNLYIMYKNYEYSECQNLSSFEIFKRFVNLYFLLTLILITITIILFFAKETEYIPFDNKKTTEDKLIQDEGMDKLLLSTMIIVIPGIIYQIYEH
jgi:hypothetical protein